MPKYLKEVERLKINRYQQVIVASKCARILNARSSKDRSPWHAEGSEKEKRNIPPPSKVADRALKSLLDGEVEYGEEKTEEIDG